ncbi:unnamed protein product, partial [Rotaria sp. Silwood2]
SHVPIWNTSNDISNKLNCIRNCATDPTGYSASPVWSYCTDVSSIKGSTVGRRSDIVNVEENSDFIVAFPDSAWCPLATLSCAH